MRIHRSGGRSRKHYYCNNCLHYTDHQINKYHYQSCRQTIMKTNADEIQMQTMVRFGVSSLTAFMGIKFQTTAANSSTTTINHNPFETHPWFMYISILSALVFFFFDPRRYPSMKFKLLRKISGSLTISILASLCLPAADKPFSSSSSSWSLYLITIIIFTCAVLVTSTSIKYSYDHHWLITLVNNWLHGSMILITSLLQRLHVINKRSSTENSQLESSSSTDQPVSNVNDDSSPV